jgi:hypothetical protein
MTSELERVSQVLAHDVDAEVIEEIAIEAGWAYSRLFDEVNAMPLPVELKIELFAVRRSYAIVSALVGVANRRGIPFNFRRLSCNGQRKLLMKIVRVILIQEPILTLSDAPKASDYKRELAESHGVVAQLELELGDEVHRITDWSDSVLAVLLHGAYGKGFSREDRKLGALELAIPTSSYQDWVMRLDLRNTAMFGWNRGGAEAEPKPTSDAKQPDNVNVTVRRRAKRKSTGTR